MIKKDKNGNVIDWGFSLSYSTYSVYKESPLQFYFMKIAYAKPTNKVFTCYGNFGQVIHRSAEKIINNRDINMNDLQNYFLKLWNEYDLDNDRGFGNKLMDKQKAWSFVLRAKQIINGFKGKIIPEEKLEFQSKDYDNLNIKGFIDVVEYFDDGTIILYDWKSNASSNYSLHKTQRLFYSWLFWKIKGIIPKKTVWIYFNSNNEEDSFNEEEIIAFDNEIKSFIQDIKNKGNDINNYDLGKFDGPFNVFKDLCYQEKIKRANCKEITVLIKDYKLEILTELPKFLEDYINNFFAYRVKDYFWTNAYKKRVWDGYHRFYKKRKLPFGFVNKLIEIIEVYNKKFNENYEIVFDDRRNKNIMDKVYDTKFSKSDKQLRYYQEEAINSIIENKVGIIYGSMSFGKTFMSAELIRRLNKRTLFIINRVELVRQTAEEWNDVLGVDVGVMIEGNLNISNQITVASIQTIHAILKRDNEESQLLKKYLYNVNLMIFDEVHQVSDSKMYDALTENLANAEYVVGLSGTPFRNENDTLRMNALVGFPIYTKKSQELIDEGYIVPCEVIFQKISAENKLTKDNYQENYVDKIVENDHRNKIIVDNVNEWRKDKKIIVVVKSIKHGEILQSMIKNSFFINGSIDKKLRKEKFEEFKKSRDMVLISMVKIMGIGINIPDLDIIYNVSANSSPSDVIQLSGRTQRKSEGKNKGYYIDLIDGDLYFNKVSLNRIETFKNFGINPKVIELGNKIVLGD